MNDLNGEQPMVRIVTSITNDEHGIVRYIIPDGEKAESLPENCVIEFDDVQGMFSTTDAAFAVKTPLPSPLPLVNKDRREVVEMERGE